MENTKHNTNELSIFKMNKLLNQIYEWFLNKNKKKPSKNQSLRSKLNAKWSNNRIQILN